MKKYRVLAAVHFVIPIEVESDNEDDAVVEAESIALQMYRDNKIAMNDTDDFVDPMEWDVQEI